MNENRGSTAAHLGLRKEQVRQNVEGQCAHTTSAFFNAQFNGGDIFKTKTCEAKSKKINK